MRIVIAFLLLTFLAGCDRLGIAPVDTPDKQWAVAQDTLSAITVSFVQLMNKPNSPVDGPTAMKFVAIRNQAQLLLDQTRAVLDTGSTDVTDLMAKANEHIVALQAILDAFADAEPEPVSPILYRDESYAFYGSTP